MLVVDGTNAADTIAIVPGDRRGEVKAIVNGVTSPSFRPTGRILVFGYGGNDSIVVSPAVRNTAWLIGGADDDLLMAGGGPSLLMGNDGNDTMLGGLARDLLIGGDGLDSLTSAFGSDILVGGMTRFDSQPAALNAVFELWSGNKGPSSNHGFSNGHASHGKSKRRNALTDADIVDDGDKDTITGRRGSDLIFASTTGVVDEVVKLRGPKNWDSWHDHDWHWRKVGKRPGSYSLMEYQS
jgi:Ca2+-binding RTX toxin-like protein